MATYLQRGQAIGNALINGTATPSQLNRLGLALAHREARLAEYDASDNEVKGEAARLHVGVIAQRVADIFASHGLDADRYGLFCYDEWEEWVEPAEYGDDGELVREEVVHPAGNRYGIRYSQLAMFLIAAQEARLRALEAQLN